MDKKLHGGMLANAIAVIALTVGQRHPVLAGDSLVDASGVQLPFLYPLFYSTHIFNSHKLFFLMSLIYFVF